MRSDFAEISRRDLRRAASHDYAAIAQFTRLHPQTQARPDLATATTTWKIYALFNHDLGQVFVGATDASADQLPRECATTARQIMDWEHTHHHIDWMERVEEFPTLKHARLYANWLHRDGAFDGVEHYSIGLDEVLVA